MNPILDQLKDIHPPGHVPWWPPAVGWWATVLLIALLAVIIFFLIKIIFKARYIKAAHSKLDRIYQEYSRTNDAVSFVREVSKLLRRVCMTRFSRRQVAGLTGRAWLEFLDKGMGYDPFSNGKGRILLDAPYRKTSQYDVRELYLLCQLKINSMEKHHQIAARQANFQRKQEKLQREKTGNANV